MNFKLSVENSTTILTIFLLWIYHFTIYIYLIGFDEIIKNKKNSLINFSKKTRLILFYYMILNYYPFFNYNFNPNTILFLVAFGLLFNIIIRIILKTFPLYLKYIQIQIKLVMKMY